MRAVKLTRQEKNVEDALLKHEYVDVSQEAFKGMAQAIAARRKDAVLNLRINRLDLENIKMKSRKMGVKYQTFIPEILHQVARA